MKLTNILIGIAIALLIYTGFSSFESFSTIKGNGNVIKETRDLAQFHSLDVGGAFTISISQGSPQKVIVESDDNILPQIITKVKNGQLEVSTKGSINNASKLNIEIVVENIDALDISGACELKGINTFSTNKLEIDCSGASEFEMALKCKDLEIDFSGASKGKITGTTKILDIEASGASSLDCMGLEADVVSVEASGASNVSFSANKIIKIDATGASSIDYESNGATLEIETSGASSTHKK